MIFSRARRSERGGFLRGRRLPAKRIAQSVPDVRAHRPVLVLGSLPDLVHQALIDANKQNLLARLLRGHGRLPRLLDLRKTKARTAEGAVRAGDGYVSEQLSVVKHLPIIVQQQLCVGCADQPRFAAIAALDSCHDVSASRAGARARAYPRLILCVLRMAGKDRPLLAGAVQQLPLDIADLERLRLIELLEAIP